MVRRTRPGISRFRVRIFDAPRNDCPCKESPCPQATPSTSPCSAAMASALK
ncbi:hypothetical protein GWE18_27360 [Bradyrhizobium sp. CSA112]|nr:hypothetical protein [Bradyrhizobium sp. CSA112]